MGNIRPSFIKLRAIRLCDEYGEEFYPNRNDSGELMGCDCHDNSFDHNKQLVEKYTDVPNKRLRNWIAGYVTRYRQRRVD